MLSHCLDSFQSHGQLLESTGAIPNEDQLAPLVRGNNPLVATTPHFLETLLMMQLNRRPPTSWINWRTSTGQATLER